MDGRTTDTAPDPIFGQSEHKLSRRSLILYAVSCAPGAHDDPKNSLNNFELLQCRLRTLSLLPASINATDAKIYNEIINSLVHYFRSV